MTITLEQALQIAASQQQAGQFAAAEATCRGILARQPDCAVAWHRLGLIALTAGRPADAAESIPKAIALAPGEASYHSDLGVACWLLGRREETVACFRRALTLRPDLTQAHYNLGDALHHLGQREEAIASFQRAIAFRPDYPEALNGMGNVLAEMGRMEEAAACYQRAVHLNPSFLQALSNLGDTLMKLGRLDEAMACCERALALKPDFADGHLNRGVIYWRQGRFEAALESDRRAIACRADFADAHMNLGIVQLLCGRYEEGWREYEWRSRSPGYPGLRRNFSAPQWDGSPAAGRTILVHVDQGFGDLLNFVRYVPLVRARSGAARVILECQPPLLRLLAQNGGWDAELVARDDTALPPFDLHIPLLSLPLALRVFDPLTTPGPYLHADPALRAAWRERLRPGFRVGVAWAGNPEHRDDRRRSIAFEKLAPILRTPGVSFYSLQVEVSSLGSRVSSELPKPETRNSPFRQAQGPEPAEGKPETLPDFADAAALVAELDLVISVDTATVHLAGALGRPVWTLLPFVPDWRWGLGREDTPWYPSMRLFRQPAIGDWDSVIERVAAELRGWQASHVT